MPTLQTQIVMFKPVLSTLLIVLLFTGCKVKKTESQEADRLELLERYQTIVDISTSVSCTNADDWEFTAIGAKACGGPQGYIAYSSGIDVANFLNLVSNYTIAEHEYNIKWGIISDCTLEPVPTGVICEDEMAKLVY